MARKQWGTDGSPREMILAAATQVFAADGYNAGSLNTVADKVGITRHLLLHYFPSKKDLLIAVLEDRDRRLTVQFPDASKVPIQEFIDRLEELLPAIFADQDVMRLAHRLRAEVTNSSHPAHAWVKERQRRIRGDLSALFRGAMERNELPQGLNPDALAIATLGAVEGIEGQCLVDPDLDWAAAIDSLRKLFFALLVKTPET